MRSGRSGFSLTELLVVIAVVILLVGILAVALSGALRAGNDARDRQALRTLGVGVRQFKIDHGFDLPLAYDGAPLAGPGPAVLQRAQIRALDAQVVNFPAAENGGATPPAPFVAVYSPAEDADVLRGGSFSTGSAVLARNGWRDPRYSRSSLPIYLTGYLPARVDGVDGPGMSEPSADGSFKGRARGGSARRFEPSVEAGRGGITLAVGAIGRFERDEMGVPPGGAAGAERVFLPAFVDEESQPIRFYRWLNGRSSDGVAARGGRVGEVGVAADLNIPGVFQNPELFDRQQGGDPGVDATADGPAGSAQLRGASWGIVAPGRDGLFGTETDATLAGVYGGLSPAEARARAQADNVVEVGE